jgi:hypothetical protein
MSWLPHDRDHDHASARPETTAGPAHLVHRRALQGHVATRHLRTPAIAAPGPGKFYPTE